MSRSAWGGDAADFDFGPAEVDRRAWRLAGGAQVAPASRDVRIAQPADHFQFDNHLVRDQQAGGKDGDDLAVARDDESALLDGAEPAIFSSTVPEEINGPLPGDDGSDGDADRSMHQPVGVNRSREHEGRSRAGYP